MSPGIVGGWQRTCRQSRGGLTVYLQTVILSFMDDESRDKLVRFCIDNDITYLAVFGSTIKGAAHPDSDIDLIVRFKNRIGLIAMVRLQRDLETLLGKKVDLVTEKSISIHFRAQVLEEAETIYDAA